MKFGGTSVGSAAIIQQLTDIVRTELPRRPLVVVSAASKVTDLLLGAARRAAQGEDPDGLHGPVREREHDLLKEMGLSLELVDDHLDRLVDLLKGISLLGELTLRTLDRVAACGEQMSARIVAEFMRRGGLQARDYPAWDFGMLTDSNFGSARMIGCATERIRKAWAEAGDVVPVVTGFIGKDAGGHVTTLGRGGSDLSASLFGTAIGAEEIQIWTDVSGIMTCDPRLVPAARVVPEMSFEEAAELAYFGAKVLHPGTIEPATRAGIPVVVKNTFRPQDVGTWVLPTRRTPACGPVSIATSRHVREVNINATRMLDVSGFLARVFGVFGQLDISVDVVATSEVNVSFTVDCSQEKLQQAIEELSSVARVTVEDERSIICIVGEGLKYIRGLAGEIFRVVGELGVNIDMISQGASEINVTFVIRDEDCERTLQALHRRFFESPT